MSRRVGTVLLLALAALSAAQDAVAHPLAPSLLELRERDAGIFDVTWKTSLLQPTGADVRPELPEECKPLSDPQSEREASGVAFRWRVDCGDAGVVNRPLRVLGLDRSRTDALVRVELADGRRFQTVLSAGNPETVVPERQRSAQLVFDYAALGVDHILTGFDHLLFVWGLMLLVVGRRALLLTITAFTLGHSVTLALAVLGYVSFPTGPVELAIAFSILVLAVELANPNTQAPLRRRPALLAAVFGLLHGLGFAGALAEVGLPPDEIPLSLLSFNVGIELGQLVFVFCVLVVGRALVRVLASAPQWVHGVPAYVIGSLAVFWCLERAESLLR